MPFIASRAIRSLVPAVRVLILDDDPAMARTTALLVARLGYEPVQYFLPTDALLHLHTESFDLLLSDYEMPLLTGLELVALLREEACQISVVLMSGNAASVDRPRAQQLGITAILEKPFTLAQLDQALRQAIAGNATKSAE